MEDVYTQTCDTGTCTIKTGNKRMVTNVVHRKFFNFILS